MEIGYSFLYHEAVVRDDIPTLDAPVRTRIKNAIEQKLTFRPELFSEPLRKSLRGYRKLRVGDYRVVLKIKSSHRTVYILIIKHRSVAYRDILKRI